MHADISFLGAIAGPLQKGTSTEGKIRKQGKGCCHVRPDHAIGISKGAVADEHLQ